VSEAAYEVVILDIDGTLVDSNDAHANAWVDAFRESGIEVPYEKVRRLIGKGGDKLMPEVSGIEEDDPRGKKLAERRAEIFKEKYLPTLKPFPAVRELMEALVAKNLRLVVATSAKKEEVGPLLKIANVTDLIDKKTSSDDAENSKPDPDIVAAAVKRAKVSPNKAVMIGDTPYDIEAARGAGVACIAFRCGGWGDKDLGKAIAVYDGAAELLAGLAESPLVAR
jgi:HAD superfamily hydrolase (TIGR01509 family)